MKYLLSALTAFLFVNSSIAQSQTNHLLYSSQISNPLTIDSVSHGTDLTSEQLASFKILSMNGASETSDEFHEPLISFDLYRKIDSVRSNDENIILTYGQYVMLVYRRTLTYDFKQ